LRRRRDSAYPDEPDPGAAITLSYQETLDAVAKLHEVDFPIGCDPADAWPDFVGWRVSYELAAYTVAYASMPCQRCGRAYAAGRAAAPATGGAR